MHNSTTVGVDASVSPGSSVMVDTYMCICERSCGDKRLQGPLRGLTPVRYECGIRDGGRHGGTGRSA